MPWKSPSLTFKPKRHSFGGPGPWSGHLAFACDLVAAIQPKLFVELGTFYGESYFGFCQAVEENSVICTCYAVDTWQGDAHGGFYGPDIYTDVETYNRTHYGSYSHLLRMTFDEAVSAFSEESIDILHIDGHHSYDSVRHDFDSWIRMVRPGGIILLHDIYMRRAGFGVWRYWQELCASFPHFEFAHSSGLGVVMKPGEERTSDFVRTLLSADIDEQARIGRYYATVGERVQLTFDSAQLRRKASSPSFCAAQVFYSFGQGYSQEQSIVRVVELGVTKRVTFDLPEGIPVKPLRIDPADRACVIEIFGITVVSADRSIVLYDWDGTGSAPAFQVSGTARILAGQSGIAVLSDGIDPQLLFSDVGGEEFERPLELDLVLRITASAEINGLMIPLADLGGVSAALELDRAFLRDEVRPVLTELRHRFGAQEGVAAQTLALIAESGRKGDQMADLINHELSRIVREFSGVRHEVSRIFGEVATVRAAVAANTENVSSVRDETSRVLRESETLRAGAVASHAEILELRRSLESAAARCRDLEQSWSWRGTAPARSVIGWFGKNRPR